MCSAPARDGDAQAPPERREPYFISGWERPRYRGSVVRFLHATRLWYVIAAAYVVGASTASARLSPARLGLRALAAVVTSINIFVSDGYHNADRRGTDALTAQAELVWLRWDYFVISWILTYNIWLWCSNFGWGWSHILNLASGGATAVVGVSSRLATVKPMQAGHLVAIGTMALQYVGPFAYLLGTRPPVGLGLALCLAVFCTYGAGLALWALRYPRSQTFGYHEWFHVSVVLGHLTSMACDLRVLHLS